MATGACGIHCDVCGLLTRGLCSTCGPGDGEEASVKIAAQTRLIGAPCSILECARQRRIAYCLRDCSEFPCDRFSKGPYPFGDGFLSMQVRRRNADASAFAGILPLKQGPQIDPGHWEALEALNPKDVTTRCLCTYDDSDGYGVSFLGETFFVDPVRKEIRTKSGQGEIDEQLPLVLIFFLLRARDIPPDRELVTEKDLPDGALFFRHLHRLSTHVLEDRFGRLPDAFMDAGKALGGRVTDIAPSSFELRPLPRIPVGFNLWPEDEEFPAKCTVTFDRSIHKHLPLDVIRALVQVLIRKIAGFVQTT